MQVALVSEGRIKQIFQSRKDMEDKYHPDFIKQVIDVPNNVFPGYYQTDTGWVKELPPTPPSIDDFSAAVQIQIDLAAQSRGYGDGFALSTYINSTLPQWAQEAEVFIAWRDQVWLYAYAELYKVQQGQRPIPTINELIAELPTINWPE